MLGYYQLAMQGEQKVKEENTSRAVKEQNISRKKHQLLEEEKEHDIDQHVKRQKTGLVQKDGSIQFEVSLLYSVPVPHLMQTLMFEYTQLSSKKFATVKKFKGKIYVDIREYYESGGEMKPGKKGECESMGMDMYDPHLTRVCRNFSTLWTVGSVGKS